MVNGCIAVNSGANSVTIKNMLITSDGSSSCQSNVGDTFRDLLNAGQDVGGTAPLNLLVQDVTVDGTNWDPGFGGGGSGVTIPHGECLRCNVFGFIKNYTAAVVTAQNPMLFQDSYSHDMGYYSPDGGATCAHSNGFWLDSSAYVTLNHDYAIMNRCVTGAISLQTDYGNPDHITVENSYMEGGDGMDFTGGGSAGHCATNTIVQNNMFSNTNGYSGTDFSDYSNTPGITWSGNYVAETGAALSPGGGC